MAATKKVAIGLGVAGRVILVPGLIWFFSPRLTNDDAGSAFSELVRVPLSQIGSSRSVSASITIPDTSQWKHVRHAWGDPAYTLVAVKSPDQELLCLNDLGIHAEVLNGTRVVPSERPHVPYGYSIPCSGIIGYEFRAAPGSVFTIRASVENQTPLPSGELILIPYWDYEKDKIVGLMIDQDLRRVFMVTSPVGLVLVLTAGYLMKRTRRGH